MRGQLSVIGSVILALAVLFVLASIFVPQFRQHATDVDSYTVDPGNGFTVFDPQEYVDESDQLALDSLHALVLAINTLAEGGVAHDTGGVVEATNVASYELTIGGQIMLEEVFDEERIWIAQDDFSPHRITDQEEQGYAKLQYPEVYFSYEYGYCGNQQGPKACTEDSSVSCDCRDGENGNPSGLVPAGVNSQGEPNNEYLAPIINVNPLSSLRLTVTYQGGESCTISTRSSDFLSLDNAEDDLLTWGHADFTSCQDQGGCDRNGNGVYGSYDSDRFRGKLALEQINAVKQDYIGDPRTLFVDKEGESAFDKLFPEGKITSFEQTNGENCWDSPTWLQCDGIRVYYCGRYGAASTLDENGDPVYFDTDYTRSTTGAKFMAVLDESFKGQVSSYAREKDDAISVYDGEDKQFANELTTRVKRHNGRGSTFENNVKYGFVNEGYFSQYIKPHKIYINPDIIRTTEPSVSETDPTYADSKLACYNAQRVGQTGVPGVSCSGDRCAVCDFSLPQQIPNDPLSFMAGYGDPNYLVYYQAFPAGEEEAWQLSPVQIGMQTIVLSNLATAAFPLGGTLARSAAKINKVFSKIGTTLVKRFGKEGVEVGTRETAEAAAERVAKEYDRLVEERVQLLVKKGLNPEEATEAAIKQATDNFAGQFINFRRVIGSNPPRELVEALDVRAAAIAEELAWKHGDLLDEFARNIPRGGLDEIYQRMGLELQKRTASSTASAVGSVVARGTLARTPRYAAAFVVGYQLALADSIDEKFQPIGSNALGFKQPLEGVFVSGHQFGIPEGNNYLGLSDAVKKFDLYLVKDRFDGWFNSLFNQNNQKFFLASPCEQVHLSVRKGVKTCYLNFDRGKYTEGTDVAGQVFPEYIASNQESYTDVYGKSLFYFSSLPQGQREEFMSKVQGNVYQTDILSLAPAEQSVYDQAIKACDTSQDIYTFYGKKREGAASHKIDTIYIDPVPVNGGDFNTFCYGGSTGMKNAILVGQIVGNVATSIAIEAVGDALIVGTLGFGTPVIRAGQIALNIGSDIAWAKWIGETEKDAKWPNHGAGDQVIAE